METIQTNSHVASYSELRVMNDLLIEIANALMRIESHLLKTPLKQINDDEVLALRKEIISTAEPLPEGQTQD